MRDKTDRHKDWLPASFLHLDAGFSKKLIMILRCRRSTGNFCHKAWAGESTVFFSLILAALARHLLVGLEDPMMVLMMLMVVMVLMLMQD